MRTFWDIHIGSFLIIIYQIKDQYIYVDQARYAIYCVEKYLYIDTVKSSTKFNKTNFPSDKIFTKADTSTSDEKVDKLTREFNFHYRACIGSFICYLQEWI